jgi:cobalt-zinc-cadmium resistance protein CzcA
MLSAIISFSTKNKLIIGLFVLGLIGYGSYQFTKLPIDAVPDITDNQVQVITSVPSLGAPDIERLITFPIEQANSNIPGLKEIRSFSRFGLSLITIVFEDDVDIYWARQQVTERLKQAQEQIPEGLGSPELAPVTTGLGEIYQYTVRAKKAFAEQYTLTELRTIQDWIIRRQLLGVKGVADVSSFGGKLKQYEVALDINKLKALNVTIKEVFTALQNNNENAGGAYIEKKSTVLYIRSEGLLKNSHDIKNVLVKSTSNGTPLYISDVADVRIGNAIRYGAMTYNDEGETTGAVVMMLKGSNSNEVIKNVKERIKQIEKTLPEGIVIEPFLDRSKMVNSTIGTVSKNLMEGALIVIFVLVLFLGNFRAGLLVASVIPLSMLFAIILMNIFGVSGNLMSLGALDFGLIVDGAVIIVEAAMHRLHREKTNGNSDLLLQSEMDSIVNSSAKKMMNYAVFGQIIIFIVYLPILTLEGIEGKMFIPMAQTVSFALLGAFLLSLTYIPMMSALVLSKKTAVKRNISDKMMDFFIGVQQKLLKRVLNFPKRFVALAFLFLLLSLFLFSRMGGEFIPELPEGDFAVETRVLMGSNLNTTVEECLKASKILKDSFPEVIQIVGKIGSGEIPTDPMPMEAADLMIILKDKSEWTSAESWDELSEKMAHVVQDLPGVAFSFQYPVAMRFNELMTGAKQDVVCKLFGENLDTLSKYSKIIGEVVRKIDGTESVFVEPIDGLPQLIINYKRNLIAQYGLSISDVNKVVNTAFAGQSSGELMEDEKRFDIVVRLAGEQREKIEDVKNLLIPTPHGTQIALYQIADVSVQESVNQIQRDDAKRRIIVGFNIKDRDVQSIVLDMQKQLGEQVKLPSGYYLRYGGAFQNLEAASKRLLLAVPISLFLIFLFLYFAFGSIKYGLLIYSAIPLSAIGGIVFLYLRGMPFSISAGVGFIALFGVAVLNGIVLVAEFNRLKSLGETNLNHIVMNGTKERLRPVLMTAFVASLGFLPMALSSGAGAEVQRPLATVVIGGLLIATLLTLFVLPALYVLFEGEQKSIKKIDTIPVLLFLVITGTSFVTPTTAQNLIELKAALDTAYQNNLSLKSEKLNASAYAKLKQSAYDIPKTSLLAEYGQINSALTDSRFVLAQSFKFPTVYQKQKSLLGIEWQNAELAVSLRKVELRKEVSSLYVDLLYLKQLKALLLQADSNSQILLQNAKLRFEKGEYSILERNFALAQHGQVSLQLAQVEQDYQELVQEFNLLLNAKQMYIPNNDYQQIEKPVTVEGASILQHPYLLQLQQHQKRSSLKLSGARADLLPDLFLAYSNTSFTGVGADNIDYSRRKRFQSFQGGIGIPLFFGAPKAKIQSLKIDVLSSTQQFENAKKNFEMDYQIALQRFNTAQNQVMYYENEALKNALEMQQAAQLQFSSGNISFLEWTQLYNQAVLIQSNYLLAIKQLNRSKIELNYLSKNE